MRYKSISLTSEKIQEEQKKGAKLAALLWNEISLKLRQLIIDSNKIFADASTGYIQPIH